MIFVLVALLLLLVFKAKIFGKDFNKDFVAKDQTDALNGIFILIVFISHIRGYLPEITGTWPVAIFCNTLGQMMVTSFMFISGYGCTVSFLKKGIGYVKAMPRNRILPVLVNLDIAVLLFFIMNLIIGIDYKTSTIVGAFFGWTSIGNSNWYIFSILILYIIFYICFRIFGEKEDKFGLFLSLTVSTIAFIKIMEYFKTPSCHWWYDTAFCFLAGIFFGYYKDKIYETVTKSNARYFSLLAFFLGSFIVLNQTKFNYTALYLNVYSVIFICTIVLILMKVKIGNKALSFCGSHVFEIYILQRIPMILLYKFTPLASSSKYYYYFFIAAFAITIVLAYLMHFVFGKVDGVIKNGFKKTK